MYWVNIRELNRVLVTKYLSYIDLANSLYYTNLAYFKGIYILYTINIWYNIIILKLFTILFVIYDCVTDYLQFWQIV